MYSLAVCKHLATQIISLSGYGLLQRLVVHRPLIDWNTLYSAYGYTIEDTHAVLVAVRGVGTDAVKQQDVIDLEEAGFSPSVRRLVQQNVRKVGPQGVVNSKD